MSLYNDHCPLFYLRLYLRIITYPDNENYYFGQLKGSGNLFEWISTMKISSKKINYERIKQFVLVRRMSDIDDWLVSKKSNHLWLVVSYLPQHVFLFWWLPHNSDTNPIKFQEYTVVSSYTAYLYFLFKLLSCSWKSWICFFGLLNEDQLFLSNLLRV